MASTATAEKILLVDDDTDFLDVATLILESAGFNVVVSSNGEEATRLMKNNDFDLILLDLHMPGMSGHDVMQSILENEIDISIVVLSGKTEFTAVRKAFRQGAFDYIGKPFKTEVLIETVRNALKKRSMEKSFSHLRRQLERSERLHRFMIESSPDIIFIVDKDGVFVFANDRAEDLLGYKKDELIGKHFSSIIDPADIEKASHCFSERRASTRASRDEEVWLLCKPGTEAGEQKGRIAIELNSMGVYEKESLSREGEKLLHDYTGTYVVARDITERLASEKLIHYQAYHDLLTGLPNRALFMDSLTSAIREAHQQDEKLCVLFLDLDRFKVVNDTLGHSIGDKLLKQAAERLIVCLGERDIIARLGGDEFIILLHGVESTEAVRQIARSIVSTIKQPFILDIHEIFVTASMGGAIFPEDGISAEALIKNSDIAMYHTKAQGKDGFYLFESSMSAKQQQIHTTENSIRRGIKEKQFEVFYQPQVSALDGKIIGVEALLRWNHPEMGLLSPAYFLEVAEDSGLIVELGEWVLLQALKEVWAWHKSGVDPGRLAINFSCKQIEQAGFVSKIISSLRQYDFPGDAFEIEITESTLMNDVENTVEKLRSLHDFGIYVAIDDFGTGYSSLSLLQKLPINRLKIDRSFIQDMEEDSDRSIIEAIAHMAKGLNLDMVAEGVEHEYQLRYLRKLQCPVIQGYIYSPALPAEEARMLIKNAAEGHTTIEESRSLKRSA